MTFVYSFDDIDFDEEVINRGPGNESYKRLVEHSDVSNLEANSLSQTQSQEDSDSTGYPLYSFRHRDKWLQCITWRPWVPICCLDVSRLISFSDLYQKPAPAPFKHTYFFGDFPINYVYLAGWIHEVKKMAEGMWAFSLEDGTGVPVQVVKFHSAGLSTESTEPQFAEIFGEIEDNKRFGRQVKARTVRLRSKVPINEEIDMYYETYRVRTELIEPGLEHYQQDHPESVLDSISLQESLANDTNPDDDQQHGLPTKFVSFSRPNSVLSNDRNFEILPTFTQS